MISIEFFVVCIVCMYVLCIAEILKLSFPQYLAL